MHCLVLSRAVQQQRYGAVANAEQDHNGAVTAITPNFLTNASMG